MSISDKFLRKFRNWKTDSRPTRPEDRVVEGADGDTPTNFEDFDTRDYVLGDNDDKEKPKQENHTKNAKKSQSPPSYPDKPEGSAKIINVVNSSNVHFGAQVTTYVNTHSPTEDTFAQEDLIVKTPEIVAIMRSEDEPQHVHLQCVSRNLGKRWKSFFRSLGYTEGHIETIEEQEGSYGLQEVRYKLLLDWKQNDKIATVGALASSLWRDGHCSVVQELAMLNMM